MARSLIVAVVMSLVGVACFEAPSDSRADSGTSAGGGGGGAAGGSGGGAGGGGGDAGFIACVDAQEPNDAPDAGTAATARMHIVGQSPIQLDAMLCGNEINDWYRGYADCCPGYGVTVTWDAGFGSLKVSLYDAALNELTADAGLELVDIRPGYVKLIDMDRGGYFFARVSGVAAPHSVNVPYSLTLQAPVFGP